jgi:hypothetical protein
MLIKKISCLKLCEELSNFEEFSLHHSLAKPGGNVLLAVKISWQSLQVQQIAFSKNGHSVFPVLHALPEEGYSHQEAVYLLSS